MGSYWSTTDTPDELIEDDSIVISPETIPINKILEYDPTATSDFCTKMKRDSFAVISLKNSDYEELLSQMRQNMEVFFSKKDKHNYVHNSKPNFKHFSG